MLTITIINHKGGVLKSSLVNTLLAYLTIKGKKAVAVDLDSQCSLTFITNGKAGAGRKNERTIWEVLHGSITVVDALQHLPAGDLIPGSDMMSLADTDKIFQGNDRAKVLAKALKPLEKEYDYCIIDTPPALGSLSFNALAAADYAVIPAQADVLSIQGISKLFRTVSDIQHYVNNKLQVAGVVITRYNSRSNLSRDARDILEQQAQHNNTKVFNSTIREAIVAKEAQMNQEPIFSYAPKSNVAIDLESFCNELLDTIKDV